MMIKDLYNRYKKEQEEKEAAEEPAVYKSLVEIVTKEDIAKIMMGKSHELNHLAPKVFDTFQKLRDRFKGSSLRMAEKLADDVSSLLTNDGLQDLIHEGFDPIVSSEELTTKFAKELIETVLSSERGQTYEELLSKGKHIFVRFVGETITEIVDGFKEGEPDCFKWIQANIERYHSSNTP